MGSHFLLYGHGGSYNHGAEAITKCTIELFRKLSPGCEITLSTHFADQDREFSVTADEFVERDLNGKTNEAIYAPTIKLIKPHTVCVHVGGDNYCYGNWQRWTEIHYAALERNAYSILWSCSVDSEMIDDEMLAALKSHHLITARESVTYNALIERGCVNVIKVSDVAFGLKAEVVDFQLDNHVTLNISPLVIRKYPIVLTAYQKLTDYILRYTTYNIALVPHVVQPVDNDCEALRLINTYGSERIVMVSDKISAAQLKHIIGKSKCCVTTRTHAAIASYSNGVPTIAIGYSAKSKGIADDLKQPIIEAKNIVDSNAIVNLFVKLMSGDVLS